jgi:glycyl-tRNA synthetase
MVVEMTALQGIIGGHYARRSGESEAVAVALEEQYQTVSSTPAALALALADRCDSLLGLFAVGLAPRGSNDPFALRRAALGVIENLTANSASFDLRQALHSTAPLLPVASTPDTINAVLQFISGRLEGVLRERGYHTSAIKAVLAVQAHNPYAASQAVEALDAAMAATDWLSVLEAYARCVRITRPLSESLSLHANALDLPTEQALWTAYQQAAATLDGTVPRVIAALRTLVPVITSFFIEVLVMDEDRTKRENRLALLQHIASIPQGVADLSYLEGF